MATMTDKPGDENVTGNSGDNVLDEPNDGIESGSGKDSGEGIVEEEDPESSTWHPASTLRFETSTTYSVASTVTADDSTTQTSAMQITTETASTGKVLKVCE